MSLEKQTQKWVDAGLIADKQRAAILSFESKNGNRLFWHVAYVIAASLIGLGAILVVVSNWSIIGAPVKILGDFAILGGLFYGVYWSVMQRRSLLREVLTTISFFMVGATVGLIGQIFQLSGGWTSLVLFWALLALPLVLLSRVKLLSFVWICLLFSACDMKLWRDLADYIMDDFRLETIVGVVSLYVAHLFLDKIGKRTEKLIVLPTAASDFFLGLTYLYVWLIALKWGMFDNYFSESLAASAIVLGFFGWRMYAAVKTQQLRSFRTNTIMVEVYIFLVFLAKTTDVFASGMGFIFAGLFVLGFLYILRQTIRFIKGMEAFQ